LEVAVLWLALCSGTAEAAPARDLQPRGAGFCLVRAERRRPLPQGSCGLINEAGGVSEK